MFRIFSAKPNVKGIEKFVGIIHELAHVLFQSPFNATKKLFKDNWGLKDEDYKFFFNVFNVLEDQRIESQMGKMYLKHASRFDKTTKKLGKLMGNDVRNQNPIDILLAIRFQRGNDIINDTKDYDVYAKALEDVLLTDRFGALRVMVTIKPYLDKYLSDRKKILNVQDAYTCQDICQDNPECTFFLYIPSKLKCFLKGTPFSKDDLITDPNNRRVVGKKWCHAATTQVPGLAKWLIIIHSIYHIPNYKCIITIYYIVKTICRMAPE